MSLWSYSYVQPKPLPRSDLTPVRVLPGGPSGRSERLGTKDTRRVLRLRYPLHTDSLDEVRFGSVLEVQWSRTGQRGWRCRFGQRRRVEEDPESRKNPKRQSDVRTKSHPGGKEDPHDFYNGMLIKIVQIVEGKTQEKGRQRVWVV